MRTWILPAAAALIAAAVMAGVAAGGGREGGDGGHGNGTNDVNWLEVLVDPSSREVFAYQPQIVPANRVAVPAP